MTPWTALDAHQREQLHCITPDEVALIEDEHDRGFLATLIRLADNPRFVVSDDDLQRLERLLGALRPAEDPSPAVPIPVEPEPIPALPLPLEELPPEPPAPLPAGQSVPRAPGPAVRLLAEPPRGVQDTLLRDYVQSLRFVHRDPTSANLGLLLLHDARKLFYAQRVNGRAVTSILPCPIDGVRTWAVCPVYLTDHFIKRWRERSSLSAKYMIPHIAVPVPASPAALFEVGASWNLIASVLLPRKEFEGYRIGAEPPDLAIRDEHGVMLLRHSFQGRQFDGYVSVTYVPLRS